MKKPPFITDDNKIRWHSDDLIDKRLSIGRLHARIHMRRNNGAMGRLGGGWAWKLGILAGRTEVVFELFVMSIRISWKARQS